MLDDTIIWYTGFCAATTAGSISMGNQIIKWIGCSDLYNFVKALVRKDALSATKIVNTEEGKKLLVILCETGITMLLCSISPAEKALKNYVNTVTL